MELETFEEVELKLKVTALTLTPLVEYPAELSNEMEF